MGILVTRVVAAGNLFDADRYKSLTRLQITCRLVNRIQIQPLILVLRVSELISTRECIVVVN